VVQLEGDAREVHDLDHRFLPQPRSAARSAAAPLSALARQWVGWRTRAMFDHYNIIDELDLAQAVRSGSRRRRPRRPRPTA